MNDITYTTKTSPVSSDATRFVEAPCPTGTRPVGGSAVIGGSSTIVINAAVPSQTGFEVFASEPVGGVAEDWFIVANAVCVSTNALPGFERRESFSPFNSAASNGASVGCSAGKMLVGVGGLIDSDGRGQDKLVLTAVRPADDLRSVFVGGHEAEVGYDGNWRVKAIAICANPLPGLKLTRATSVNDESDHKLARSACPTGTRIYSVGFDLTSGLGQVHATSVFPDLDLNNNPNLQGVEAQGQEDANGFLSLTLIDGHLSGTRTWSITALGICAQ